MKSKYYAVRVGKTPGIYRSWEECKNMVNQYPGAIYKSFTTEQEAREFLGEAFDNNLSDRPYAFVDGSYNAKTKVYGYGGFVFVNGEKYIVSGSGSEEGLADMRNVAGEILGSMAAVKLAIELGIKNLDIYYDYMGIEMWATGGWKRNKQGTMAYYEYMQSVRDKINLRFIKVKGHSGIEGNEEADIIAKKAVNLL